MTRLIEVSVNYVGIDMDVRYWSQYISFFLVGVIAITSVRGEKFETFIQTIEIYFN